MPDSIDKRLREILPNFHDGGQWKEIELVNAIAQINAAYADELIGEDEDYGEQISPLEEPFRLGRNKLRLEQRIKLGVPLSNVRNEYIQPNTDKAVKIHKLHADDCMTGQDWYNRFMKEFEGHEDAFGKLTNIGVAMVIRQAEEAAKKSSGIEEGE